MNPNQCTNPITKSLCILFDRETGGCLREGNEDQVRPPSWCPMRKRRSSHQTHENAPESTFDFPQEIIPEQSKNLTKKEISGVTPKPQPCPCGCGLIPEGREGKVFYNRHHKDVYTNRLRLRAAKKLWEILLMEADLRGYEVRKKGG